MEITSQPEKSSLNNFLAGINCLGYKEAIEKINTALSYSTTPTTPTTLLHIITANPTHAVAYANNDGFRTVYDRVSKEGLITVDGIGIQKANEWLLGKKSERVTGIGLSEKMFTEFQSEDNVAYIFLGASNENRGKAVANVKLSHGIDIAGEVGGKYGENDDGMLESIKDIAADNANKKIILLMASTVPIGDLWIDKYREKFPDNIKVAMNVGQAFDVWSGNVKRAPEFYQCSGLEWLYRLINNPEKNIRRQQVQAAYVHMVGCALAQKHIANNPFVKSFTK